MDQFLPSKPQIFSATRSKSARWATPPDGRPLAAPCCPKTETPSSGRAARPCQRFPPATRRPFASPAGRKNPRRSRCPAAGTAAPENWSRRPFPTGGCAGRPPAQSQNRRGRLLRGPAPGEHPPAIRDRQDGPRRGIAVKRISWPATSVTNSPSASRCTAALTFAPASGARHRAA